MIALFMFPERDCATCTRQVEWGCGGDAAMPVDIDGVQTRTCPRRPVKDDPDLYFGIVSFANYLDKGHLVWPGSVKEQPAKLITMYEIFSATRSECQEAIRKREVQKQEAQAKMAGHRPRPPRRGRR